MTFSSEPAARMLVSFFARTTLMRDVLVVVGAADDHAFVDLDARARRRSGRAARGPSARSRWRVPVSLATSAPTLRPGISPCQRLVIVVGVRHDGGAAREREQLAAQPEDRARRHRVLEPARSRRR